MSLTPEQIAEKDFLVAMRGYDKEEVRYFLRTVAAAFRSAAQPAEPEEIVGPDSAAEPATAPAPASSDTDWTNLGEEIAAVLRTAHEQASGLRTDAQNEVTNLRQEANDEVTSLRQEANDEAAETRSAADAHAEQTRSAADAHAEQTRAEAEQTSTEAAAAGVKAQDEALALMSDAQARVDKMMASYKIRAQEEADASVAHLTVQVAELASARDVAKTHLTDLRTQLDMALATAEAPVPSSSN